MKQTTWHVLPSHEITHVTDRISVFNPSDTVAHVEVTATGELIVKPLDFGMLTINYLLAKDA